MCNEKLMNIETIFFELLQVAIGNRNELSCMPNAKEWKELFDMSKKQSLLAVTFAGVSKLSSTSDFRAYIGIDEMTYLKWLGLTSKVAQRNKGMNNLCIEVCKDFVHDGLVNHHYNVLPYK